jgi:glycosyltransferase involved in cell wall biosynthesis
MNEKLSVLIPVLNGAPFIAEAMESLERQTHRHFEVLAWDNGSTDDTLSILKQWLPGRLPGHVFSDKPLSLGLSLRRLVEVAPSELCARMDIDDVCHPDRFRKQLDFLREQPGLAIVGTDRNYIDVDGNRVDGAMPVPNRPSDVLHGTLIGPNSLWHPTVMFRKSCILEVGNYQDHSTHDEPYWSEDYDLWMRLQSRHLGGALPDRLLEYRINPVGVTQMAMREKRASLARRRVWERNSAGFTGLPVASAMQLHGRTSRFALPSLWHMAGFFSRLDKMSPFSRMKCPSFLEAISKLISRNDFTSRLWIKAFKAVSAWTNQPAPKDGQPRL